MDDYPSLVYTLEDLLVKEFRICQLIHSISKEERQALSRTDANTLEKLVEQKEAALDELGQIEDKRRMTVQDLGQEFGVESDRPSIAEIAGWLPVEIGNRVNHLREGIVALSEEIRVIISGNRTLATTSLDWIDSTQTFLLDTFRPALCYERPGAAQGSQIGAVWDLDQLI
jgi:flagellar biosynthesis/type III secretory pathway chaperone